MSKGYQLLPRRSPNEKPRVLCRECNAEHEHHAKGLCQECYRKQYTPKLIFCRNCGKKAPHKAFGLCATCHTKLHHYGSVRSFGIDKQFQLTTKQYQAITAKCMGCDFDKIVHVHRLDGNAKNNNPQNLIGLCPNCQSMIRSKDHFLEVQQNLAKNGVDITKLAPNHVLSG